MRSKPQTSLANHHSHDAEAGEVGERCHERGRGERAGLGGDRGDGADRDARHVRAAANRAKGDQLLPRPEGGAGAEQGELERGAAGQERDPPELQRIPVKLIHSPRVGSSCGILYEKVSVRKHRRAGIEYERSARKTSADRL